MIVRPPAVGPDVGGVGGVVPAGGTGGADPVGGTGGVEPVGGTGGVEPVGGVETRADAPVLTVAAAGAL